MKGNCDEVKLSVYAGMSIFSLIKDYKVKMKGKNISLEDKKYLSLYLGILNTKNSISDYLEEKGVRFNLSVNYNFLSREEYLNIYNKYFTQIFNEISLECINDNLNYLLNKKIIQDFNRSNGHYVDKTINDRNKQLIKTIK